MWERSLLKLRGVCIALEVQVQLVLGVGGIVLARKVLEPLVYAERETPLASPTAAPTTAASTRTHETRLDHVAVPHVHLHLAMDRVVKGVDDFCRVEASDACEFVAATADLQAARA